MLFHITAKNNNNNWVNDNNKLKEAFIESHNNKDYLQIKYNVKLLHGGYDLSGCTMYFLAEASSAMNLSLFMMDFVGHSKGLFHDFTTIPVEPMNNILIAFKKKETDKLKIDQQKVRNIVIN
jgi:hypothetical protein